MDAATFYIAPFNEDSHKFVWDKYDRHGTYHFGDSGLDLFCPKTVTIPPTKGHAVMYPLGILAVCVEKEISLKGGKTTTTSFFLLPRSSTGAKTPLRLSNSVGLIDGAYRGQLCALIDNVSDEPYTINEGDRLFQLCTRNLGGFSLQVVDKSHPLVEETSRGGCGFGSTGK